MATTKIKAIKKRLDHVIDYTTNPSKTSKESYQELHNVIEYAKASYKTEEQLYVTALNCSKDYAYHDMMRTKKNKNKLDGIMGFHVIQSFKEGEVTPEIAHEIGVKLAQEMWGDRFEVIITTHLNTNCLHNHFCLNSVSFKDGRKYYDNHKNYALLRDTSDRLCEEYHLSVLKEKECPKSKLKYENFLKGEYKSNYIKELKEDIDFAIGQSYSYDDFLIIMKKMDYVVENRAGKLSVRRSDRARNTRIERVFGENYSLQNIKEKIYDWNRTRVPFPEARAIDRKYKYSSKNKTKLRDIKKPKITGIRALYFHYCYLLKIYPKKKHKMSKELREEVKKMDMISKEAVFLSKNKIKTDKELASIKESINIEIKELKSRRYKLYKMKSKVKSNDEIEKIESELDEIRAKIKVLNEQIRFIEDIESRIPKMKEELQKTEENQRERSLKGKEKYR